VLAIAEREGLSGEEALFGIAVGVDVVCRASLVAPKRIHQAGFHPTAVLGAMGAAAGVAAAMGLEGGNFVSAQGIAGSMAGGIIEYLAEGAWTKRMHPGWAAQSGIRAVELARAGFVGPRTVWEGTHGLLHGFANTTEGAWEKLTGDFGERWVTETIAFKPYPCGTMIHPYIDCARRLAKRGVKLDEIEAIVCDVGEGTVHRLWEPLAAKRRPPNGYAAKFSQPWCIAYALVHGQVGLEAFADACMADERVAALAAKVDYRIDPANPYPDEFTGHCGGPPRQRPVG
jgi:2-methylcitrate dehydratase PrpD